MHEFRKKILIQTILLVCIIGIFSTFYFLFRKNISHQIETLDSLKLNKYTFSQSASSLIFLKREWEVAKEYKDDLAVYIPKKDDLVRVPNQLKEMGKGKNVSVVFVYGTEEGASETNSVKFTATLDGSQGNIRAFLEEVERKFHHIVIDTMDVSVSSASSAQMSIAGKVYYY